VTNKSGSEVTPIYLRVYLAALDLSLELHRTLSVIGIAANCDVLQAISLRELSHERTAICLWREDEVTTALCLAFYFCAFCHECAIVNSAISVSAAD
jgi:hypothetical protein